jgi:hypothetical protein
MAIVGFVIAAVGFISGLIPFAGFVGLIGAVICILDLQSDEEPGQPKAEARLRVGVALGTLSTLGAICWVIAVVWLDRHVKTGSCPHLYAFDGDGYRLDADLASGALYRGAERDDMDRLESLRAVNGEYRVRLQNDLDEIDNVDSLELLVVDADRGAEVLPTQSGALVAVRSAKKPLATTRTSVVVGGDPRDLMDVELPRLAGDRAVLVLRARNTRFAEKAFVEYMAKMGQGVRPLMELRADSAEGCACYQRYLAAEVERMGLPLWVSVSSPGGPRAPRPSVQPVGPAVLRTQAVPIDLPRGGGDRVIVRLEATPRFWEIDAVEIAPLDDARPDVTVLAASGASTDAARDLLATADQRRVVLRPGEHVDVRFAEPPPPAEGRSRTVVARLRGYYDLDIGGQKGVNVARLVAHRAGWVSLPRFATTLEH